MNYFILTQIYFLYKRLLFWIFDLFFINICKRQTEQHANLPSNKAGVSFLP